MTPFLNLVVLKVLLLLLHMVPPSREGVQVVVAKESKVVGSYTVLLRSPGYYAYQFKGTWEEGKSFSVERSPLYAHLYTAYPDPKGEPVAINLIKELESLSIPKEGESSTLGEGEVAITVTKMGPLLFIGSESAKFLFVILPGGSK